MIQLQRYCSSSSWPVGPMLVLVFISMASTLVTSQSSNINSTLMKYSCGLYQGINAQYFLANLNTTLSSLRRQLPANRAHYAVAHTLINSESVWGLALCREYVSNANCVACFDYAVAQLKVCGLAYGARAFYDDCHLRYTNYNFYGEASLEADVVICGNTNSPQPKNFRKMRDILLSELRTTTPKTSNFYAASTRRMNDGNGTIYAIAQCNLNLSQGVCEDCLNSRYTSLHACGSGTTGRAIDDGCFMRYSTIPFFGQNQTTDITPFLSDGYSRKKRSVIGGVVGGVCFLLLILAFFLWFLKSKNTTRQEDKSTGSTELLQGPTKYNYNDLQVATNNFSNEYKLGGGVFGEVYKGTFKDGAVAAIKKTSLATHGGKSHFDEELKIICNIHHRHLLRLLGYCRKGPFLFLVHEYMDNGSLDKFLYGDKTKNLNWRQRFDIIFGIARGLAYLHEQYHVTIIHKDIKTSNVLLDNELKPKITDFGLIRLLPEDKTHLSTTLAGSLEKGYVAPEYALHGKLSEKVDTYSFGVVVLEIISGKRCDQVIDDVSINQNLLDHAWNAYETDTHLNLMDKTLDPSEYEAEDAKKIIEIALMCTQSLVSARPAMSEVVTFLSDKLQPLDQIPQERSNHGEDDYKIQVDTSRSMSSNATTSTVQLSGR